MKLHTWVTKDGTRGVRTFVNLYDHEDGNKLAEGRFEGYVASGAQHTGIGLTFDDDTSGIRLSVGLSHVVNLWITVGSWHLAKRLNRYVPNRDIADVRFHDRIVWWTLWHDKHSYSSDTPRWRNGSFHWWDWLTGKPVLNRELIEGPVGVTIPMPEGGYQATAKIERSTWKRPRWPWPQVHYGYDVDVISRPGPDSPYTPELVDGERPSGYIPVPGKGENAWDCGPDGTFSMSGPGRTIEAAIGDVVAQALRERKRHAGRHDYAEPIS